MKHITTGKGLWPPIFLRLIETSSEEALDMSIQRW